MLGDENLVAIFRREHTAGIEAHANRRAVRIELARWSLELAARVLVAELGVLHLTGMTVRIAERQSLLRRVIQLVGRHIVSEQVAAVVGEPHLAGLRMPV